MTKHHNNTNPSFLRRLSGLKATENTYWTKKTTRRIPNRSISTPAKSKKKNPTKNFTRPTTCTANIPEENCVWYIESKKCYCSDKSSSPVEHSHCVKLHIKQGQSRSLESILKDLPQMCKCNNTLTLKDISKENFLIECSSCRYWVHSKCENVTSREDLGDPTAVWYCSSCRGGTQLQIV